MIHRLLLLLAFFGLLVSPIHAFVPLLLTPHDGLFLFEPRQHNHDVRRHGRQKMRMRSQHRVFTSSTNPSHSDDSIYSLSSGGIRPNQEGNTIETGNDDDVLLPVQTFPNNVNDDSSSFLPPKGNRFSKFAPDPNLPAAEFRAQLRENMKADLEERRRKDPRRGNQPAKSYLDGL